MDDQLKKLAQKLGIATEFSDAGMVKKEYVVDEKIIRFFAQKLGYKANTTADVTKSLEKFDRKRWHRSLEAVYVCEQDNIEFDVVIPDDDVEEFFNLRLRNHLCVDDFEISFDIIDNGHRSLIGKTQYARLNISITSQIDPGYYDINLIIGEKAYKTVLALAPKKCYKNESLDDKLWGYALQLYSVKSERNWGVGDFTDLANMARIAKKSGADIIGVNPLNVLMHDYPENASPYSSVSRLFLNPIYIDVENVPEFKSSDIKNIAKDLEEVRSSELIKYEQVYTLKINVLTKLYQRFLSEKNKEREAEYKDFCKKHSKDLENLAIFQSLYSDNKDNWGGWRAWSDAYKNLNSLELKTYAKDNAEKIGFFKFLQFESDRQFNLAQKVVDELKLKVGFYRDLAVGVGQDSVEYWAEPFVYCRCWNWCST